MGKNISSLVRSVAARAPARLGTTAVASGGEATITMAPMSGVQLEYGVIPNNISEAKLYGKTIREAREND
jgi:DUF917 family protein